MQEVLDPRLNGGCADHMPSLLSRFIDAIQLDQSVRIVKDQHRQLERDSSVLALVLCVLPVISFVAHGVYTNYTTSSRAYAVFGPPLASRE
jgi:hypothetical protein